MAGRGRRETQQTGICKRLAGKESIEAVPQVNQPCSSSLQRPFPETFPLPGTASFVPPGHQTGEAMENEMENDSTHSTLLGCAVLQDRPGTGEPRVGAVGRPQRIAGHKGAPSVRKGGWEPLQEAKWGEHILMQERKKKPHNIFAVFLARFLLPSDIPFLQNSIQLLLLSPRSDNFIFRMRQNFLLLPQQCHLSLRSNTFAARKIGLLSSSSAFDSQGHAATEILSSLATLG